MIEAAFRVYSQFHGKESIWSIGIGQGIIYINSFKPLLDDLKCIIMSQCFPIFAHFTVSEIPC